MNHIGNSTAARFNVTAYIGPNSTPTTSSSSAAGPVAGGVVGAIVGAAGIVFAILFARKQTSRKKMEALARTELDLIDTVVRRPEIAEIEIPGSCILLRNRIGGMSAANALQTHCIFCGFNHILTLCFIVIYIRRGPHVLCVDT
eukprot:Opistho-2@85497